MKQEDVFDIMSWLEHGTDYNLLDCITGIYKGCELLALSITKIIILPVVMVFHPISLLFTKLFKKKDDKCNNCIYKKQWAEKK